MLMVAGNVVLLYDNMHVWFLFECIMWVHLYLLLTSATIFRFVLFLDAGATQYEMVYLVSGLQTFFPPFCYFYLFT